MIFVLVGAIEVTIANMSKTERSSTDEIYVVGFVPSYQLPKARPCALDPFLHPLISDIEDIFIEGKLLLQHYKNLYYPELHIVYCVC